MSMEEESALDSDPMISVVSVPTVIGCGAPCPPKQGWGKLGILGRVENGVWLRASKSKQGHANIEFD